MKLSGIISSLLDYERLLIKTEHGNTVMYNTVKYLLNTDDRNLTALTTSEIKVCILALAVSGHKYHTEEELLQVIQQLMVYRCDRCQKYR